MFNIYQGVSASCKSWANLGACSEHWFPGMSAGQAAIVSMTQSVPALWEWSDNCPGQGSRPSLIVFAAALQTWLRGRVTLTGFGWDFLLNGVWPGVMGPSHNG